MRVTRYGQCAQRHAMKTIGKGGYVRAAGYLTCQLKGRFDNVGSGWAGELQFVFKVPGFKDDVFETLHEAAFRGGVQVETVGYSVCLHVFDDGIALPFIVVPIIKHTGAGKKIDEFIAVFIPLARIQSFIEYGRIGTTVGSDIRLEAFKYIH